MTTIYLIRHGEAEGNAFRRTHGQYDSILTPNGFRQLPYLEERFRDIHVDACYSSDLTRTSLTARSVYVPKGLKLNRDPAFREIGMGVWEDCTFGYLEQFEPEQMYNFSKNPACWHAEGAETLDQWTGRFIAGLKRVAEAHTDGTVTVFCHGGILRTTLMRLFFEDDLSKVPYCDNTAVSKLFWDGERFSYEYLNDSSHVPQELSTFARQKWWREGTNINYNMWFKPLESCPEGFPVPEPQWVSFVAMLGQVPVGILSLDKDAGAIAMAYLLPDYQGKTLEDQFLGQAVSYIRRWSFSTMKAVRQRMEPQEVLDRYGFTQEGEYWQRNVDPKVYSWD